MGGGTALLITGVLVAGLGACGSDDGVTKAEWTEKANSVCADAQAELDALGPLPIGEPAKLPDWASKGIAIRTRQIDDLKALEEPKDDADAINATLDKASALLDEAKTTLDNAQGTLPLIALSDLQNRQTQVQTELAGHGPQKCGPKTAS